MPKSTRPVPPSLQGYLPSGDLNANDHILLRDRSTGAPKRTSLGELGSFLTISSPGVTSYCVSGAGTAAANGTYVESVEVSGRPSYVHSENPSFSILYLWGTWVIREAEVADRYLISTELDPDSEPWLVATGTAPAPTVTAGACGA